MGEISGLLGEIYTPEIVGYMRTVSEPHSFKSKSQNVTKMETNFLSHSHMFCLDMFKFVLLMKCREQSQENLLRPA